MRQDVAVQGFSIHSDPRTAGVGGERANRRELAKHARALFGMLGPSERVLWVLGSPGLRPLVGALTTSRLLLFSQTDRNAAPEVVSAPFTLEVGRKKFLGQAVTVRDPHGAEADLTLIPSDYAELRKAATPREGPHGHRESYSTVPGSAAVGKAAAGGGWRWGRPVFAWQDAEHMAADHMRHMRFAAVTVTPPGRDSGLDVIANTGAAQVKFHATPTGAPEVQKLRGAADAFPSRLFYAMAYTPTALSAADAADVAMFQFTVEGDVVGVNAAARSLMTAQAPPSRGPQRGIFGQLTRHGRQERAVGWAQQIQEAAAQPISNRKRKGARQLAERQQALQLLVTGLAQLEDSDNPLYKQLRKDRTLAEAERTLKKAAAVIGLRLR